MEDDQEKARMDKVDNLGGKLSDSVTWFCPMV